MEKLWQIRFHELMTFHDFVKHFQKMEVLLPKLKGFKFIKLGFYKKYSIYETVIFSTD